MTTYKIKCIICKKEFIKRIKSRSGNRKLGAKANELGKNRITCSRKCSRKLHDKWQKYYQQKTKFDRRKRDVKMKPQTFAGKLYNYMEPRILEIVEKFRTGNFNKASYPAFILGSIGDIQTFLDENKLEIVKRK